MPRMDMDGELRWNLIDGVGAHFNIRRVFDSTPSRTLDIVIMIGGMSLTRKSVRVMMIGRETSDAFFGTHIRDG